MGLHEILAWLESESKFSVICKLGWPLPEIVFFPITPHKIEILIWIKCLNLGFLGQADDSYQFQYWFAILNVQVWVSRKFGLIGIGLN